MIVDAIVLPFGEPLVVETSSKRREALPEPIVDWPVFGSQQSNARDLLGRLRGAGVRCDEEADGEYDRDSGQPPAGGSLAESYYTHQRPGQRHRGARNS